MTTITTSSNAIVQVNQALNKVLQQYLDRESQGNIDIRFDLPDVNSTPSTPTVSVFLYDVHEDLQLRQSEPVRLNVSNSTMRAGWVNLSCNYLITYWEAQSAAGGKTPESNPDNQAAQVMTKTLHALLNNRELEGIAGAFTRIIPPQENLNSLGNFWQALGNRPRLSLMYSVTVPIMLDNSRPQTLVKTVSSEIVQASDVDMQALNAVLLQTLQEQLGSGAEQQLARIVLSCQPQAAAEESVFAITIGLTVSGLAGTGIKAALDSHLQTWGKSKEALTKINGKDVYIGSLDSSGLTYI